MSDIAAFLKARLDEDEHAARRIMATRHGALIVAPDDGESPSVFEIEGSRLLADVEAKRKLLNDYEAAHERARQHPGDVATSADLLAMVRVVKALALPYADHPDYQESWKP